MFQYVLSSSNWFIFTPVRRRIHFQFKKKTRCPKNNFEKVEIDCVPLLIHYLLWSLKNALWFHEILISFNDDKPLGIVFSSATKEQCKPMHKIINKYIFVDIHGWINRSVFFKMAKATSSYTGTMEKRIHTFQRTIEEKTEINNLAYIYFIKKKMYFVHGRVGDRQMEASKS